MKIIETPEQTKDQPGTNERGLDETESASVSQGKAPQAGSLAAALGMVVDDSEQAPPVRHVIYQSPAPESSTKVSETKGDSPSKSIPSEVIPSAPSSLAAAFAALGLNFDPTPSAPEQQQDFMPPQERSLPERTNTCETARGKPR